MATEYIMLAHGSGGRLTNDLIKKIFVKNFSNSLLNELEDSAILDFGKNKIAFTTDSYVISPIFFPGGDIGRIAVCGTVNDLSVKGAKPIAISAGFIIEENFRFDILEKIVLSMKKAANEAGIKIVTGDTKVVEKGKADGLFINTSGIGIINYGINISQKMVRPGDVIIINGEIASHGIAVLNERNKLGISGNIKSDVSPLNTLLNPLIKKFPQIKSMRDITRGGLATILNEVVESCGYSIEIDESLIPISPAVRDACSILGIDPLYVANEGKVIIFVPEKYSMSVLKEMRKYKYGRKSAIIGRVINDGNNKVKIKTLAGYERYVVMLETDPLPRIC